MEFMISLSGGIRGSRVSQIGGGWAQKIIIAEQSLFRSLVEKGWPFNAVARRTAVAPAEGCTSPTA